MAIPVAVVITEQVVSAALAASNLERLIYGGEKVFSKIGGNGNYRVEVGAGPFGIEATKEVAMGGKQLSG